MQRVLLAMTERSVRAARPRWPAASPVGAHLDRIIEAFMSGYRAALSSRELTQVAAHLDRVEPMWQGFGYEGAAMALALLDGMLAGRPVRLRRFIDGLAQPYLYMAYVGAGWAAARLWRSPTFGLRDGDPVLGWLSADGYGFHHGFFFPDRFVRRQARARRLSGYATRVFDQGLGRSLWFIDAADIDRIETTIGRFSTERHADLWSGVALAATYAGGLDREGLRRLPRAAANWSRDIAQGAAFAAEARVRAGYVPTHAEDACRILTGMSAAEAARIVREARAVAVDRPGLPAYEDWRVRIGTALATRAAVRNDEAPLTACAHRS